jgi:hypothetical protein
MFSGKLGLVEHSPAMKWFLNVRMARSANLRRWTWGGAPIGNQCQRCRETLATLLWPHCLGAAVGVLNLWTGGKRYSAGMLK